MRDIFIPILGLQWIFAIVPPADSPLWERLLEKWGIAFVGIALLFLFAQRTDRLAKVEKKEQAKKDADVMTERIALLTRTNELGERNNQLQEQQLASQEAHSLRLEKLTRDGTKAVNDSGAAMRMLVRKMQRPCVAPFTYPEESEPDETPPAP